METDIKTKFRDALAQKVDQLAQEKVDAFIADFFVKGQNTPDKSTTEVQKIVVPTQTPAAETPQSIEALMTDILKGL